MLGNRSRIAFATIITMHLGAVKKELSDTVYLILFPEDGLAGGLAGC